MIGCLVLQSPLEVQTCFLNFFSVSPVCDPSCVTVTLVQVQRIDEFIHLRETV